eukprot:TRINITY_DN65837_c0_g1_i1.p1 TRINITY_DN65837_c0_g1~~TRINITY_DN65837_c0_g1_i1.p1  ORF type:complete len:381 (+),score=48.25 TRINITY_DN65837_c0_g1_i1:44-1186(+)
MYVGFGALLLALSCFFCFFSLSHGTWADGTCRRLPNLPQSVEEFEEIIRAGEPVIFENARSTFGPTVESFFDFEALRRRLGDQPMSFSRWDHFQRPGQGLTSSRGDGVEQLGLIPIENGTRIWRPFEIKMTINEVLTTLDKLPNSIFFAEQDAIYHSENKGTSPMFHSSFAELPDFLLEDNSRIEAMNMWVGLNLDPNKSKESHLHEDGSDNLMLQIFGRKEWILYEHDQAEYLYLRPLISRMAPPPDDLRSVAKDELKQSSTPLENFSPVDPVHPDFSRFPLFEKASAVRCTQEAGSALFFPSNTFHHVISYGDGDSKNNKNVGINIWFEPECGEPWCEEDSQRRDSKKQRVAELVEEGLRLQDYGLRDAFRPLPDKEL